MIKAQLRFPARGGTRNHAEERSGGRFSDGLFRVADRNARSEVRCPFIDLFHPTGRFHRLSCSRPKKIQFQVWQPEKHGMYLSRRTPGCQPLCLTQDPRSNHPSFGRARGSTGDRKSVARNGENRSLPAPRAKPAGTLTLAWGLPRPARAPLGGSLNPLQVNTVFQRSHANSAF
jgi:hypothetical protein